MPQEKSNSDKQQEFYCRTKRALSMFHKSELEILHKILSEYKCAKNEDRFFSLQWSQELHTFLYLIDYLITIKRK